jgi:hypothetical protein
MSTKADKGFSAVLKELDSRSVRVFEGRLPWPYNGMVHDITGAIQKRCNYLAAMGLAAYTEICGRQIVYRGKEKSDEECFNAFIEYMGIGEVLHWRIQYEGHPKRVKDAVRNGLVHQYFMKSPDSTVVMISSNSEAKRFGIHTGSE